jgi:hypothetical protein
MLSIYFLPRSFLVLFTQWLQEAVRFLPPFISLAALYALSLSPAQYIMSKKAALSFR